jgi:hypothetical protein
MKRLHICVIDLVFASHENALYQRLMYGNYMSIMPQVIGVWCRQEGHKVTYILYGGFRKVLQELPLNIDIAFISAFSFTAQLAYALSNLLRSRGIVTILGGPHARCYPEDACKYFDFVLGLTDRKLIHELLLDFCPNRPTGIYLSNNKQPLALPGVEERWEFIEKALDNSSLIKIVPMIGSFGCPYSCDFCVDGNIPYQQLDLNLIKKDLGFLLRKMKRPRISWYDPNFGVSFKPVMDAIEEAVPANSIDFIAECNLSILSEPNLKRLKHNGFKCLMPGIESWFGYGNKAGTGSTSGIDKVRQVADHVNLIQSYIPYVHVNLLFGTDVDEGPLPFELTKLFVELAPGVYPAFLLLNSFGRGASANLDYQRANRVLPFPFHLMQSLYTLNIRPKNYSWLEFYDYLVDAIKFSFSAKAIYKRFNAIRMPVPRLLSLVFSLSFGGSKIQYHSEIRRLLLNDPQIRSFFEQETSEIPDLFRRRIQQDLGPLWPWLPEGALFHDPNAFLKASVEDVVPLVSE